VADPHRLSGNERAKLRPTVDVAALERLLGHLPGEARAALLLACAAEVDEDDLAALGFAPEPPPEPPEPPEPRPGDSRRVAFLPAQASDFIVAFDDPELQRLWEAVEPRLSSNEGPPPDAT